MSNNTVTPLFIEDLGRVSGGTAAGSTRTTFESPGWPGPRPGPGLPPSEPSPDQPTTTVPGPFLPPIFAPKPTAAQ